MSTETDIIISINTMMQFPDVWEALDKNSISKTHIPNTEMVHFVLSEDNYALLHSNWPEVISK